MHWWTLQVVTKHVFCANVLCTTLRHRRADGRPTTSQHDANLAANVGPIITTKMAQRSTNVVVLMGILIYCTFNVPVATVRAKWNGIRASFARELRLEKESSKSGSGKRKRLVYKYNSGVFLYVHKCVFGKLRATTRRTIFTYVMSVDLFRSSTFK